MEKISLEEILSHINSFVDIVEDNNKKLKLQFNRPMYKKLCKQLKEKSDG